MSEITTINQLAGAYKDITFTHGGNARDVRALASAVISQSETIKSMGEEIERLRKWMADATTDFASLHAELSRVKQERDEAYERAAQAVQPNTSCFQNRAAIRALKSGPAT